MAVKKRAALNSTNTGTEKKYVNPTGKETKTNGAWNEFQRHVMTGISRMIPFLIMGGVSFLRYLS